MSFCRLVFCNCDCSLFVEKVPRVCSCSCISSVIKNYSSGHRYGRNRRRAEFYNEGLGAVSASGEHCEWDEPGADRTTQRQSPTEINHAVIWFCPVPGLWTQADGELDRIEPITSSHALLLCFVTPSVVMSRVSCLEIEICRNSTMHLNHTAISLLVWFSPSHLMNHCSIYQIAPALNITFCLLSVSFDATLFCFFSLRIHYECVKITRISRLRSYRPNCQKSKLLDETLHDYLISCQCININILKLEYRQSHFNF